MEQRMALKGLVEEKVAKIGTTRMADAAADDMDTGSWTLVFSQWSASVLIAASRQVDIPLLASRSDQ